VDEQKDNRIREGTEVSLLKWKMLSMWPSLSPYPLPASFFSAVVYDFVTTVADGGQVRSEPRLPARAGFRRLETRGDLGRTAEIRCG
jgi:hypothetical protein